MVIRTHILIVVLCGLLVGGYSISAHADERLDRVAVRMGIAVEFDYSATPNAYARSDGKIFVTSGLLDLLQTDDQLAFILGHEKAHTVRKHHKKQFLSQLGGFILGAGIAKLTHGSAEGIRMAGSAGAGLVGGKTSRVDEYEADKIGLKLMTDAGFDPREAASAMEKLQSRVGNGSAGAPIVGWFASHPDTGNRVRRLRQLVQAPLREVGPVGPILVIVEDRLYFRGGGGFYISTPRRIFPSYDDPTAKVAPAMVDALVNRNFDVVEFDRIDAVYNELDARLTGRFDASTLAEVGKLVGASHILVVTLVEDQLASSGNVEIRTGRIFNRRDIEAEAAQRKLKISTRLIEVQSRLIVWTSAKMGSEAALVGSYRDFGFFNGFGVEAGKTQPGRAVATATKKIADALRRDVQPAVESNPPQSASTRDGVMPDPQVATPTVPPEDFTFPTQTGTSAVIGQLGILFGDQDGDGRFNVQEPIAARVAVSRIEGGKVFLRVQKQLMDWTTQTNLVWMVKLDPS